MNSFLLTDVSPLYLFPPCLFAVSALLLFYLIVFHISSLKIRKTVNMDSTPFYMSKLCAFMFLGRILFDVYSLIQSGEDLLKWATDTYGRMVGLAFTSGTTGIWRNLSNCGELFGDSSCQADGRIGRMIISAMVLILKFNLLTTAYFFIN